MARAAFSSWVSWRAAAALELAGPAAAARAARVESSATTRHHGVEDALHPGLEQQRHLDDRERRVARAAPAATPTTRSPTSGWSSDSSQRQLLGPLEDDRGDPAAVDARRPAATSSPQRSTSRVAHARVREQLVDDRVGRQRRGAEPRERGQRLGLAGGDPAGQADERPVRGPPASGRPHGSRCRVRRSSGRRRLRRARLGEPRRPPRAAPPAPAAGASGLGGLVGPPGLRGGGLGEDLLGEVEVGDLLAAPSLRPRRSARAASRRAAAGSRARPA